MTHPYQLVRRSEVERLTGLSRASIYRLMAEAKFPRPIRIGERAVRWLLADLEAFIASRVES